MGKQLDFPLQDGETPLRVAVPSPFLCLWISPTAAFPVAEPVCSWLFSYFISFCKFFIPYSDQVVGVPLHGTKGRPCSWVGVCNHAGLAADRAVPYGSTLSQSLRCLLASHCRRSDNRRIPSCQELSVCALFLGVFRRNACGHLRSVLGFCLPLWSSKPAKVAFQSPGAVMSARLLFCLCSAIVAAFGEKQLERGWQEGGSVCGLR